MVLKPEVAGTKPPTMDLKERCTSSSPVSYEAVENSPSPYCQCIMDGFENPGDDELIFSNIDLTSGELNATSAETLASNTEISLAIPSEMDWSRSNGSFYTVQVGVYSKLIDQNQLPGVNSVMIDRVNNKLFRYTSGQFNSLQDAQAAKDEVVASINRYK